MSDVFITQIPSMLLGNSYFKENKEDFFFLIRHYIVLDLLKLNIITDKSILSAFERGELNLLKDISEGKYY